MFTGTIMDQIRKIAIKANPSAYMYTSEGYAIQIDMKDGSVFFVDPKNGKIISEEWYNYQKATAL